MQTADVNSPGEEIRPELLTVLTTEHFTLQGLDRGPALRARDQPDPQLLPRHRRLGGPPPAARRQRRRPGSAGEHGRPQPSRWQLFFTLASMVAVLNSIVGGTTVALVAGKLLGAPIGVAVLAGGVVALAALQGHVRLQRRMHDAAREGIETLLPSGE